LYVTDHGQKNAEDSLNNSITLWGPKESLSVSELRELLRILRPGVRVVMLMSQCYSGAFAHLVAVEPDAPPTGNLCGYFSSTADRPAYGCYPENRGKENVGHSFHFIQALAIARRFPDAHLQVLVSDATPDVPLRTSDVYLEDLLRRKAAAGGEPTARRLGVLRKKSQVAESASYRMEVRLGVVLRMRAILTAVAGRVYLASRGTPEERAAYEALLRCEALALPPADTPLPESTTTVAEPFPASEDDVRLAAKV